MNRLDPNARRGPAVAVDELWSLDLTESTGSWTSMDAEHNIFVRPRGRSATGRQPVGTAKTRTNGT